MAISNANIRSVLLVGAGAYIAKTRSHEAAIAYLICSLVSYTMHQGHPYSSTSPSIVNNFYSSLSKNAMTVTAVTCVAPGVITLIAGQTGTSAAIWSIPASAIAHVLFGQLTRESFAGEDKNIMDETVKRLPAQLAKFFFNGPTFSGKFMAGASMKYFSNTEKDYASVITSGLVYSLYLISLPNNSLPMNIFKAAVIEMPEVREAIKKYFVQPVCDIALAA